MEAIFHSHLFHINSNRWLPNWMWHLFTSQNFLFLVQEVEIVCAILSSWQLFCFQLLFKTFVKYLSSYSLSWDFHHDSYERFLSLQIAFSDAIYLVDAIQGGEMLMKACKPALESSYITKVIHDCKRDSEVSNWFCLLQYFVHTLWQSMNHIVIL